MFDDLHVLVQTIETVLVGANPGIAVDAHHNTGHTGCTDDIVCAKLIAHVLESGGFAWLHKHSFLEQTQPDVAVRVFADAVNLGRTEVYLSAILGVVFQCVGFGVVDGQA